MSKKVCDVPKSARFGDGFCIEPEISIPTLEKIKEKIPNLQWHHETTRIVEIGDIHRLSIENQRFVHNTVRTMYKNKMPLGSNKCLSGGVHFHIFTEELKNSESQRNMKGLMHSNIGHLPYHLKIDGFNLYNRNTSHGHAVRGNRPSYNYSIEFRMNNVFDQRLAGYYLGHILLAKECIHLKSELNFYKYDGQRPNGTKPDWKLSELTPTFTLTQESLPSIAENTVKLLNILDEYGYTRLKNNFISYLREFYPFFY